MKVQKHLKRAICLLASLIMLLTTVSGVDTMKAHASEAGQSPRRVVGYFPYYRYKITNDLDYSALTHIMLAFGRLNEDGTIYSQFKDGQIEAIVEKAHASDCQVFISIGGAAGSASAYYIEWTKDEAHRAILADNIVNYALSYGLDGIDMDIESNVGGAFWDTYDEFIIVLREKCDASGLHLSGVSSKNLIRHIEPITYQRYDFVNLMSYSYSRTKNLVAPMSYFEELLAMHAAIGLTPDKLVCGVPFYGYCNDGNEYKYWEIIERFPDAKDVDDWVGPNGEAYNYNGTTTIREKAQRSLNYGGIMIWELGGDAKGEDSLLAIIKDVYATPANDGVDNNAEVNTDTNIETEVNEDANNGANEAIDVPTDDNQAVTSQPSFTIDGALDEWNGCQSYGAEGKIEAVYTASDSQYILFAVKVKDFDKNYQIFINVDNDRASGYSSQGYDLMIENGKLYQSQGRGWSWTKLDMNLFDVVKTTDTIEVRIKVDGEVSDYSFLVRMLDASYKTTDSVAATK